MPSNHHWYRGRLCRIFCKALCKTLMDVLFPGGRATATIARCSLQFIVCKCFVHRRRTDVGLPWKTLINLYLVDKQMYKGSMCTSLLYQQKQFWLVRKKIPPSGVCTKGGKLCHVVEQCWSTRSGSECCIASDCPDEQPIKRLHWWFFFVVSWSESEKAAGIQKSWSPNCQEPLTRSSRTSWM